MSTPARVTWRDDSLPHQIRLIFRAGRGATRIGVSCTCAQLLAERTRWDDPAEPMRIWREHSEASA